MPDVPRLTDAGALRAFAGTAPTDGGAPCARCAAAAPPGWASLPGSYDHSALERVATLRDPDAPEPTLREYHPDGTHGWSPDAPVAPGWFPYNRCDVWRCRQCGQLLLRYTEHGGYYEDERARRLQAGSVVDAPAPPAD